MHSGRGADVGLILAHDVVDEVVGHRQSEALGRVALGPNPSRARQTIEVVILIGKAGRPTQFVGQRNSGGVGLDGANGKPQKKGKGVD